MPTESELRQMLRESAATRSSDGAALDVSAIIRRSRRRRLPRQVGAAGVLTLAIAGIGFGGITALRPFLPVPSTQGSAATSNAALRPSALSPSASVAPEFLNHCGAPLVQVAPDPLGLVLTIQFPANAAAGAQRIDGTVTLTNRGGQHITGTSLIRPAIAVSQGGTVLWHTNGVIDLPARTVDLYPGQSLTYPASFTPVRCSAADEATVGFPRDLPALPPGRYQLSAAIEVNSAAGAGGTDIGRWLVAGPAATIELR